VKLSADGKNWQVSSIFFLLMLVIVIEITTAKVKVFERD
jgi:hypothetical protein